jgi:spermidine synthase
MKLNDKEWEVLKTFFLFQKGVSMQEDLLIMYNFTKNMGFNHILELGIGVEANATKAFAFAKAQLPSTSFTSVDFSEENLKISKKILEDFKLDKYVELIHSDSVEFLKNCPKNFYDCIFIDTSHSFEHTVTEIELSAEKFDPAKGKAFNYLTTCILNHFKQLYRAARNYQELKRRINDMYHKSMSSTYSIKIKESYYKNNSFDND